MAKATHDDDFDEHLGMSRMRTWHGKKPGSFVHHYGVRPGDQPEHSKETFHGIMAYHGHKQTKSPDGSTIHYKGTEQRAHGKVSHEYHAHLDKKGGVRFIHHEEQFHIHEGLNEMKTYDAKPLRSIAPKKVKPTFYQSDAPSQKADSDAFLKAGVGTGDAYPDRNGNDEGFPTKKSPTAKKPAPNVATKAAPEKLKNDNGRLDELSKDTLRRYVKKAAKDVGDREFDNGLTQMHPTKNTPEARRSARLKIYSRHDGIDHALDKMTRESVDEKKKSKVAEDDSYADSDNDNKTISHVNERKK